MARTTYYPEPKISQFLFASKYMAPFWTVVRVYLGWLWLDAGWHKVSDPRWVGPEAGTAVRGFLNRAIGLSQGDSPTVTGWYAWIVENVFLPIAPVMSYLVAYGEVLVGIALIVGFLTGLVAFLGGLMNVAFMLAGTLSSNPIMFLLATWMVLAWRIAGFYGLDYWVLPWLGAPHGPFSNKKSGTATAKNSATT
ncbi:MAG: DoxX family membrane protein [Trueperaceae bacterium]|nr:DoxX family membrane protein [Trueperaceae bacterium]